jgi:ectoine hydroxylase-related dioxygenase (phytanoyl-CoA dioxygenase family)
VSAGVSRQSVKWVEDDGFAVVSSCLDERTLKVLCAALGGAKHAQRNLLGVPAVRDLAVSPPVKQLVSSVLGPGCFAVRGILFNKTPDSNWKVVWHQDRTIAVRERRDIAEFGPWTMKAGILHVQPPPRVMAGMLAIRLHLDESNENNGPLRVIPGSHQAGCLSADEIAAPRERRSVVCAVPRGGAILMRPLLLHASSACSKPAPRRVIHLEFAVDELPNGLEWRDRV